MLLMVTVNLLFLGIDTTIAHLESGTLVTREWIPIAFGFLGSGALLLAGLVAIRNRSVATMLATLTLIISIAVGLLGTYFHLYRAALPTAPVGERLTLPLLVWAPPILGPLAFAIVGVLGISAAWLEVPTDSGTLRLLGGRRVHLPFSKTRAYFFAVGMGMMAALMSSVLDHARTGFTSPWVWWATAIGIFGMVAAITMGALDRPTRTDLLTYMVAMVLLIVSGPIGTLVHVQANLIGERIVVLERFLRGAPFLAPLLYANMGFIGLIVLLDPQEHGISADTKDPR